MHMRSARAAVKVKRLLTGNILIWVGTVTGKVAQNAPPLEQVGEYSLQPSHMLTLSHTLLHRQPLRAPSPDS